LLAPAGGARQVEQRLAAVEAWNAVRLRDRQPASLLGAAQAAAGAGIQLNRLSWSNSGDATAASLRIEGAIPTFAGDYRAAHGGIAAYAKRLKEALPGARVEVTAWPLNTNSNDELEGEIAGGALAARFQIQVLAQP
jgi:hypothetical protein